MDGIITWTDAYDTVDTLLNGRRRLRHRQSSKYRKYLCLIHLAQSYENDMHTVWLRTDNITNTATP